MASFVYDAQLADILLGDIHFDTDDIRAMLVKSTTTADVNVDAATLSAITSLNELTDASYTGQSTGNFSSGQYAFATQTVANDAANDRAEVDFEDIAWAAINNETIGGCLIYKWVDGTAANDIPLIYVDLGDITPAGATLTITWNAEGVVQLANV